MAKKSEVLCLYELDESTGEATGRITFYCSEACRAAHRAVAPEMAGTTTDAIEGTVCDNCGKEVVPWATERRRITPWTVEQHHLEPFIEEGGEA